MILTAKKYLEDLLKEIGIKKVYPNLAAAEQIKPILWALIENPELEEYQANYERIFQDREIEGRKMRIYHIKEHDASAVLAVHLGGTKAAEINSYKRLLLSRLKKSIEDPDGYRIDITPLSSDLEPEEYELSKDPVFLLRIHFSGGLWRREESPLILDVIPEGEIVKNPKELEESENG